MQKEVPVCIRSHAMSKDKTVKYIEMVSFIRTFQMELKFQSYKNQNKTTRSNWERHIQSHLLEQRVTSSL